MTTPAEQHNYSIITYANRPKYAQWSLRFLLAGAVAFGTAGAVEQIASKGPEFGIMAIELNSRIEAASGKSRELITEQPDRIAHYEAAIADAHQDRDNDWYLAGVMLAAAAIGAASRVVTDALERRVPTVFNVPAAT
jgi:hypothetical protein